MLALGEAGQVAPNEVRAINGLCSRAAQTGAKPRRSTAGSRRRRARSRDPGRTGLSHKPDADAMFAIPVTHGARNGFETLSPSIPPANRACEHCHRPLPHRVVPIAHYFRRPARIRSTRQPLACATPFEPPRVPRTFWCTAHRGETPTAATSTQCSALTFALLTLAGRSARRDHTLR